MLGSRTQVLLVVGLALLTVAPATAHPAERASVDVGRPQLVNRNSAGEVSSHSAAFGDLDRSGRYVVFFSSAPNLHSPGVDYAGVYLRDRRTGRTTMPVRNRHGKPNRMGSSGGSLSPNGRFLGFCSFDPNIVKPDSFTYDGDLPYLEDTDAFVRDLRTGATRRLSTAWSGKEADDHSCGVRVADNGDATFTSFASDLVRHDPNGNAEDTFLYDWSRQHLYRLGKLTLGGTLTGDGRLVVGLARQQLVGADHNAYDDLYVMKRRRDGSPGSYELVSRKAAGGEAPDTGCGEPYTVSHDGRYVVGQCQDGDVLDPPLPDKSAYLVLFDRKRGTHTLINPSTDELSDVSSVAVSDDGRSVFFGSMSYGYLGVPTEVGPDVYYWRRGSGLTMVSVGDDVTYRWATGWIDITGDGRQVLFESDSALVPGDNARGATDTDVYVVRIGG